MAWFVYYSDDYYDCGGVGMREFATGDEAAAFIERRMKEDAREDGGSVGNYTVIEGERRRVVVKEAVSRVAIE